MTGRLTTRARCGALAVVGLLASLLVFVAPGSVLQAEDHGGDSIEISPEGRYIVELDPTAVSPWLLRVAGGFGEDLRVHTVKSRVVGEVDGDVLFDYGDLPYVAIETEEPQSLAAIDGVVSVQPDVEVRTMLDTSLGIINATDAQLATAVSGSPANGSGRTVVIIDDGIDRTHTFFRNGAGGSRVVHEACFNRTDCLAGSTVSGAAAHYAGNWHGTHVAGIAAGTATSVGSRTFRGVASAPDIVAIKVFSSGGSGSLIDIDRGLTEVKRLVDAGLTTISAVNMSLGADIAYSGENCNSVLTSTWNLVNDLLTRGVVTVVASGNTGFRSTISWPACLSNVVAVGATTSTDTVASFSNISGQVSTSGLVAPGVSICSSVPTTVSPSGFGCASGTSMAAPHVAGALALLSQASLSATGATLSAAVRQTPTVVDDTRVGWTVTGLKRLDVACAVRTVQSANGSLSGVLRDATDPGPAVPLAGKELTLTLTPDGGGAVVNPTVTTDAFGRFAVTGLAAGTWTVTTSVTGFGHSAPQSFTLDQTNCLSAASDVTLSAITGWIQATVGAGPVVPAVVTARLTPGVGNPWTAVTLTSAADGQGAFTLSGVRPGAWDLSVVVGTSISAVVAVDVDPPGVTVSVEAPLEMRAQSGTLELTLSSDVVTGNSYLTNASVSVTATPLGAADGRAAFQADVTTDGQRRATIPVMGVGQWQITVSAQAHELASRRVTIVDATTTSSAVPLVVQRGVVAGSFAASTTVPASQPGSLVPLAVSVYGPITFTLTPSPSDGRAVVTTSATVSEGISVFRLENVPPGGWTVTAVGDGYRLLTSPTVTVPPGGQSDPVTLTMLTVPFIGGISPTQVPTAGGATITLTGKYLDEVTAVSIGGTPVLSWSIGDGSTLSAVTPARSAGSTQVVVTKGADTASISLSYAAPSTDTGNTSPPGGGGSTGGGTSSGGGSSGGGSTSSASTAITATVAAPSRPGATVTTRVELAEGALDLAFTGVAGSGQVEVEARTGEPGSGTAGLRLLGRYVVITARNVSFQQAEVCVPFTAGDTARLGVEAADMRLVHFVGDQGRRDITTRVDEARRLVCGVTDRFSPFAIAVPATERVAGQDRYATAVALSTEFYPTGAPTVYLASGTGFADALAAGAAAAKAGGPVLLTTPGALPTVVRSELVRLAPAEVVIVGGTAAVSSTVDAAVRAALPRARVVRVQGFDRYATAVEVSRRAFASGASTVYVATGLSFPDALAGAAAAGRDGAPVLLVPGSRVPGVVATELARLRPRQVVLLGGTSALGSQVEAGVAAAVPSATLTRLEGRDRYATAASVASTFAPGSTVFAATGRNFPDALAGAAIAGRQAGPVIVAPDGVLPATLRQALTRLRPARLVVLGGVGAVRPDVELQLAAFLP